MILNNVVAGIDLGGTYTKFGLVTKNGDLLCKKSLRTETSISHDSFLKKIVNEIDLLKNSIDPSLIIEGYGIGAPDANTLTGQICYASNLSWPGIIPIVESFKKIVDKPVALVNDANAAALGEMLFGVAKGVDNFIAITLGTGLGGGIVINGQLILGHDSHAGELGHTSVFIDGRKCGCGKTGCLETYVSATGLVLTAKEFLAAQNSSSLLSNIPVTELTAEAITNAAIEGDGLAVKVFDFTAEILGRKLADFVAFSSPEAIIFSGGLSNAGELLLTPVKKYMESNLMEVYKGRVKIILSGIGTEEVAILGASAMIYRELDKIFI